MVSPGEPEDLGRVLLVRPGEPARQTVHPRGEVTPVPPVTAGGEVGWGGVRCGEVR